MNYTPEWESIKAALDRVVASTGLRKADAKLAICEEISDARIAIRQHLAADPSRGLPKAVFKGLPKGARLSPKDIDWRHSCPARLAPVWTHASQRPGEPTTLFIRDNFDRIDRTVELIDIYVADVVKIFCTSGSISVDRPVANSSNDDNVQQANAITPSKPQNPTDTKRLAVRQKKPQSERRIRRENAKRAIRELTAAGSLDGLGWKERVTRIIGWFQDKGLSKPSLATIQRARNEILDEPLPNHVKSDQMTS